MPRGRWSILPASFVALALAAPARAHGPSAGDEFAILIPLFVGIPAALIGLLLARLGGAGTGMRVLRGVFASALALLTGLCGLIWIELLGNSRTNVGGHMLMLFTLVLLVSATWSCIRRVREPPPDPD